MLPRLRLLALVTCGLLVFIATARADIFSDIAGVFNTITSIPGNVVRAIYNAIKSVGDFFGRIGAIIGGAWDWMVNGFEWLGDRAAWLGQAVWSNLSWVIGTWAPKLAEWAWSKAAHYTLELVKDLERWAKTAIGDVEKFLRGLIHTVEKWAQDAFKAVWGELKKAADWIAKASRYVFDIVAHPARLVQWILADLVAPLAKWVIEHSAPVIRWLLGGFGQFAPEFVHTLEEALAKVL